MQVTKLVTLEIATAEMKMIVATKAVHSEASGRHQEGGIVRDCGKFWLQMLQNSYHLLVVNLDLTSQAMKHPKSN